MLEGVEYRRHREFLRFLGASTISLVFARWTHKSILSLRYIPNAFESNIRIPNKITRPLGPQAIVLSTGVSTGLFTMLLFGGCWIGDVDNVEEFTTGLRKLLSPLNRNKAVQDKLITEGDDTTLKEIWDSFKDK